MSEDRLQQECYLWFHNTYPEYRDLLWHTPNGGARNAREGAKFKSMGVRAGVADLLLFFEGVLYAFELKTEKGTQADDQKKWQKKIEGQGGAYIIVRNLEDFKFYVNRALGVTSFGNEN